MDWEGKISPWSGPGCLRVCWESPGPLEIWACGAKVKVNGKSVGGVDIYLGGSSNSEGKKILKAPLSQLINYIKPMVEFYKQNRATNETFEEFLKNSAFSIWAYAFIMKLNAKGFEFIPNNISKANKIELFEIKEIANQISYKLTKSRSLDNIFTPLKVRTLRAEGLREPIHQIFDNMLLWENYSRNLGPGGFIKGGLGYLLWKTGLTKRNYRPLGRRLY